MKLLRLWFCFLHSILFLISQTSYRTYKIIFSYELARPIMGTIFLVYILLASERSERDTLRSVQLRIADILYIYYSTCNFVLITRKVGGA